MSEFGNEGLILDYPNGITNGQLFEYANEQVRSDLASASTTPDAAVNQALDELQTELGLANDLAAPADNEKIGEAIVRALNTFAAKLGYSSYTDFEATS